MEKLVNFAQLNPIVMMATVLVILAQVYFAVGRYNHYGWGGSLDKKLGGVVMTVIFLVIFMISVNVSPSGVLSLFWEIAIPSVEVIYFLIQLSLFKRD